MSARRPDQGRGDDHARVARAIDEIFGDALDAHHRSDLIGIVMLASLITAPGSRMVLMDVAAICMQAELAPSPPPQSDA
jgi:hypothetical protein